MTGLRPARATGKDGQGASSLKSQSPFHLFLVVAQSKKSGKVCVCGMLFMACVCVCKLRDYRRYGVCAGEGVRGQRLPCGVAVSSLEEGMGRLVLATDCEGPEESSCCRPP